MITLTSESLNLFQSECNFIKKSTIISDNYQVNSSTSQSKSNSISFPILGFPSLFHPINS